jgi:hypothetical protein
MTRTGVFLVAMLLLGAEAMAQRPPIQEMQLAPLTGPGQPPAVTSPAQVPPSRAPVQAPGLPTIQTPGQAMGQGAGQGSWQGADPSRAILQTPENDQILGGTDAQIMPAGPPTGQLDQPAQPPSPAQPQWANRWVVGASARIQALDKVSAQATALTLKVGQPANFGSLTIEVKACLVRPPDQPADAAAYLNVTDSHADAPGFSGWMLANEPSVSMMQNPIYDLRVAGCG